MRLQGHSKAKLHYFETEEGAFVAKYGNNRLSIQAKKQEGFHKLFNKNNLSISTPKVIRIEKDCFTMSFYNGKTILDIINKGDINDIEHIIHNVISFIEWEFTNTRKETITIQDFTEKLNYLKKTIDNCEICDIIDSLLKLEFRETWYFGCCHGDLTFDNMLFRDFDVILLDFLDSYLPSPIQDITKLMQSVNLKWEYLINNNYDNIKTELGYDYIKKKILTGCSELSRKHDLSDFIVNLVYLVNLIRIVPYTANMRVYDILMKEIRRVYGLTI